MKIWKINLRFRYIIGVVASFFFFFGILFTLSKNKIDKFQNALIENISKNNYDEFYSMSKFIFTDPIIKDELYYPAIKSNAELYEMVKKISIPIYDIDSIYNKISIISEGFWKKNIFRLSFTIGKDTLEAFAYLKISKKKSDAAFCIIPQSGINSARKIFYESDGNTESDNNADDILQRFGDVFILIKLNEGCLAIHNGSFKINYNTLVPTMVNLSSSYSYYYILSSIALTKYIKTKYNSVGVVGLSQGGMATVINSIVTKPNLAVVASGYSNFFDTIQVSSITQIIYPGISRKLHPDSLIKRFNQTKTKFLFTYGYNDDDIYQIEAIKRQTEQKFSILENCIFKTHPTGHNFSKDDIDSFLLYNKLPLLITETIN